MRVGCIPRLDFTLGPESHIRYYVDKDEGNEFAKDDIRVDIYHKAVYLAEAYRFPAVELLRRMNRDGRVASASAKLAFLAGSTFDFISWHLPDTGSDLELIISANMIERAGATMIW